MLNCSIQRDTVANRMGSHQGKINGLPEQQKMAAKQTNGGRSLRQRWLDLIFSRPLRRRKNQIFPRAFGDWLLTAPRSGWPGFSPFCPYFSKALDYGGHGTDYQRLENTGLFQTLRPVE